eukprot:CAMPEP_0175650300 /NCGR_PEP_ID=MMETSP0097-20121207/9277_1 /TAXON_ID=311494 /ORGANISM="Alexandrium monilatum, Strain CCMP3105" /LENGTH=104 /DNA_ID=CAMNT_0016956247 /DNA_START=14 /DNA_END=326 /DNA_ORIENTATION=+
MILEATSTLVIDGTLGLHGGGPLPKSSLYRDACDPGRHALVRELAGVAEPALARAPEVPADLRAAAPADLVRGGALAAPRRAAAASRLAVAPLRAALAPLLLEG